MHLLGEEAAHNHSFVGRRAVNIDLAGCSCSYISFRYAWIENAVRPVRANCCEKRPTTDCAECSIIGQGGKARHHFGPLVFIHSFLHHHHRHIINIIINYYYCIIIMFYYYYIVYYYILFNIIFLQQHITITQYTGYYKCCHLYYIYFGVQII